MLVIMLAVMGIGIAGASILGLGELVFGAECWSGACAENY